MAKSPLDLQPKAREKGGGSYVYGLRTRKNIPYARIFCVEIFGQKRGGALVAGGTPSHGYLE